MYTTYLIYISHIYIHIWEATGDETSQPRFVLLTLPTSLTVRWLLNWRCPFLAGTLEEVEMGRQHPVVNRESKHEQNYGITELETLGLVWVGKLFRPYITKQCKVRSKFV